MAATRRTIGAPVLIDYSAKWEYHYVLVGLNVRKRGRQIFTQTWEVRLHNDGEMRTDSLVPSSSINATATGWQAEEVTEQKSYESPFIIIHRETWTRKGQWQFAD